MTARIKTCIIGCGDIAKTHLRYLKAMPKVEVIGVCDLDSRRRDALAAGYSIPASYPSVETMLAEADPAVIHVLTPPSVTPDLATMLLQRGIHTVVEKPMARTVSEGEKMIAAAEASGALLGVDHSRLFHPSVLALSEALSSGGLGQLVSVEVVQGYDPSTAPKQESEDAKLWTLSYPWGILDNLLPHSLYLCTAFSGRVQAMEFLAHKGEGAPPSPFDDLRILIQGESATGQITLTLVGAPERNTVTLRGTKATMTVDTNQVTEIVVRNLALPRTVAKAMMNLDLAWQYLLMTLRNTWGVARGRLKSYPDIEGFLRAFYDAVEAGRPSPVDGHAGVEIVRLLEMIRTGVSSRLQVAS